MSSFNPQISEDEKRERRRRLTGKTGPKRRRKRAQKVTAAATDVNAAPRRGPGRPRKVATSPTSVAAPTTTSDSSDGSNTPPPPIRRPSVVIPRDQIPDAVWEAARIEAAAYAASKTAAIKRISLHTAQAQIRSEARRFNVPACGRRIGKTWLSVDLLIETSVVMSQPAAYFAPTYKMLTETWQNLLNVLKPITSRVSEQEKRIEVRGGGLIDCWSFEAPDACRGRKYKRAIIDEAAHSPGLKNAWSAAIRPTLTDLVGDAWFPSTPNGMNDFWQLYQRGLDDAFPDWMCWQMPTSANPFIKATEIEAARLELPQSIFEQEYLAQFIEDGGAVFRNLAACTTAMRQEIGDRTHRYVIGIDWAKLEDFSVMTVIDCTSGGEVCYIDRFNGIEYVLQIDRLIALCERFDPVLVISEKTGNVALSEMLHRSQYRSRRERGQRAIPLWDFDTTNARKQEAVQALALAFERKQVRIPSNPILLAELQAFTAERTPSGLIRYCAPEGLHDDCVMSLMLTWWGARRVGVEGIMTDADLIDAAMPEKFRAAAVAAASAEHRQAIEYNAYFAMHEARKELEAKQPRQGWQPLNRRFNRRIF